MQPPSAKSGKMRLDVNCACAISTHLNLDLLCVAQNGIVLEPQLAKTATLAGLHKWAEKGYYDKSDAILCVK